MPSKVKDLGTVDGHNPKIILDLLKLTRSEDEPWFNDLDKSFRDPTRSDQQLGLDQPQGPANWSLSRSVPPPTAPIPPAAPSPPQVGASNVGSDDDFSSTDGEEIDERGIEGGDISEGGSSTPAAPIPPAAPSPPQVGAPNVAGHGYFFSGYWEGEETQEEEMEDSPSPPPAAPIPPAAPSPPQVGAPNVASHGYSSSDSPSPPPAAPIPHQARASRYIRRSGGRQIWHGRINSQKVLVQDGYRKNRHLKKLLTEPGCKNLQQLTIDLLNEDHGHKVSPLADPVSIVSSMRKETGEIQCFSPEYDNTPVEDRPPLSFHDSTNGNFKVLVQHPARRDQKITQSVILRHMTLVGPLEDAPWNGVLEWINGIRLSYGRFSRAATYNPGRAPQRATLIQAARVLGYPDMSTLTTFLNRDEIKAAFAELWGESLHQISSDVGELHHDDHGREPVTLRIFHSRRLAGDSEYDSPQPSKRDWGTNCHLARFCLQVEKICKQDRLPPIHGQIPDLADNAAAGVVAWGGIELARTMWRLKKGELDLNVSDVGPEEWSFCLADVDDSSYEILRSWSSSGVVSVENFFN